MNNSRSLPPYGVFSTALQEEVPSPQKAKQVAVPQRASTETHAIATSPLTPTTTVQPEKPRVSFEMCGNNADAVFNGLVDLRVSQNLFLVNKFNAMAATQAALGFAAMGGALDMLKDLLPDIQRETLQGEIKKVVDAAKQLHEITESIKKLNEVQMGVMTLASGKPTAVSGSEPDSDQKPQSAQETRAVAPKPPRKRYFSTLEISKKTTDNTSTTSMHTAPNFLKRKYEGSSSEDSLAKVPLNKKQKKK